MKEYPVQRAAVLKEKRSTGCEDEGMFNLVCHFCC